MGTFNVKIEKPKLNSDFKGCIFVGVPKSNSEMVRGKKTQPRTEFTNADILFFLEHGSPIKNVVPRPLIDPVLRIHRKEIKEAIEKSIPIVLGGDDSEIDTYFEKLALRIQGWVQMYMLREGQEVWKPSLRVLRARKKGKEAKTMIDTGSLRQSIVAFYSKTGKAD